MLELFVLGLVLAIGYATGYAAGQQKERANSTCVDQVKIAYNYGYQDGWNALQRALLE